MITAKGLTKWYGPRAAVDQISLNVEAGQIYGFLGPNGSGKTTTILMLLGIVEPDAGGATINGRPVGRRNRETRRLVGAVSENQYLYGDMTVQEYLDFFARLYRVDRPSHQVRGGLEEVGLDDRASDRTVELSKGLQQKLGLARALLHDPPVLILDEPVSGLDPHGLREVRELIARQRERGRCVFLSSHVLSEVERTADRVGIIQAGRMLVEAPPQHVVDQLSQDVPLEVELDRPAAPFVSTIAGITGVRSVGATESTLRLSLTAGGDARQAVSRALTDAGGVIVGMRESQMSLEDAFVTITDERVAALKQEAHT